MTQTSAEYASVGVVVEADQYGLTNPGSWGAKIARGSEHGGNRLVGVRIGQFELGDLFAFGDNQLGCFAEQLSGIIGLQLAARGNGFFDCYIVCLQELGCSCTAGSALAEVVPVYAFGHDVLLSALMSWQVYDQ